jgi:hypothetical protein
VIEEGTSVQKSFLAMLTEHQLLARVGHPMHLQAGSVGAVFEA